MMLLSFRRWLRRRETSRRRLIFNYTAGTEKCSADPIVIFRNLEAAGGENWQSLLNLVAMLCRPPTDDEKKLLSTEKDYADRTRKQFEAIHKLAELVRTSFDLKMFSADGTGVTEEEAIAILADFVEFTEGLAEQAKPFQ